MGITAGLSCVAPAYLVEEHPRLSTRGNYFSMYQLAITVGILFAYIVISYFILIDGKHNDNYDYTQYYSITFFICALLSAIYLVALWSVEAKVFERWKKKYGNFPKIEKEIIEEIRKKHKKNEEECKKEIKRVEDLFKEPENIQKKSVYKVYIIPLVVSIMIILIQQLVGINVVIFKIPELLTLFNLDDNDIMFVLLIVGMVNVLGTIPGMLMIDRLKKRTLFITGMVGFIISLFLLMVLTKDIETGKEFLPEKFYFKKEVFTCYGDSSILGKNRQGIDSLFREKRNCNLYLLDADAFPDDLNSTVYNKNDYFKKEKFYKDTLIYVITTNTSKMYDKINTDSCKQKENPLIGYIFHFRCNGVWKEINEVKKTNEGIEKIEIKINGNKSEIELIVFIMLVIIYIISFACTLGILGWLMPAEILPIKFRNQGMALVGIFHWGINLVIVSRFSIDKLSAFILFSIIVSLAAMFWGLMYFPETKGKRLKDIDYYWRSGGNLNDFNDDEKFRGKAEQVEEAENDYIKEIEAEKEKYKKTNNY